MAISKSKRHAHKYHKVRIAGDDVWACALPECSHYMPKHMEAIIPGKSTICWKCGEKTVMDSRTMAMDKPLCVDCDPKAIGSIDDIDVLKDFGILNKLD